MADEFKMPDLPTGYRWNVRLKQQRSGKWVYKIILQQKTRFFGFWDDVWTRDTSEATDAALRLKAEDMIDRYDDWLIAKGREGIYGDN